MATVCIAVARWGQFKDTVSMHTQHRNAAGHLFEFAIGLDPAQLSADATGKTGTVELGVLVNKSAHPGDFTAREIPAAIFQYGIMRTSVFSACCIAHA
jgi:hypothetical protein